MTHTHSGRKLRNAKQALILLALTCLASIQLTAAQDLQAEPTPTLVKLQGPQASVEAPVARGQIDDHYARLAERAAQVASRVTLARSRGAAVGPKTKPTSTSTSTTASRVGLTLSSGRGRVTLAPIRGGRRTTITSSLPSSASTSTSQPAASSAPPSSPLPSSTTSTTSPSESSGPQKQWLYAGAGIMTLPREKTLPGRVYTHFNGSGSADPVDLTASLGMNAIRLSTNLSTCIGPTTHLNDIDWIPREMDFQLDLGCIDMQVKLAERSIPLGIKITHAIDFVTWIPPNWLDMSFIELLYAVGNETVRQVRPFVEAGIQSDIFILGTEMTDGMVFATWLPGGQTHTRGDPDGRVSLEQYRQEICGQIPTGYIGSWPQLAAFYKHQIFSIKDLLVENGMDPALSRFALHSHGQYFGFKQDVVYGTSHSETMATGWYQNTFFTCTFEGIIPDHLLNATTADLIDIMGFSGYAQPMTPVNMTDAGFEASISYVADNVANGQAVAEDRGRWTSGPFQGQYKKQSLILETGSNFALPAQADDQSSFIKYFWDRLTPFESFLGALWWEPFYAINHWEGGDASLYRVPSTGTWSPTVLVPMDPLKTFYSYAESP